MVQLGPVQFCDMVADMLQKVPVMGYHDETAPESAQPVFQPGDHLTVQVVGRLIQYKNIRRMHQSGYKSHTLTLAAGKCSDLLTKICQPQLGEHGLGFVFVQFPKFRREVEKDLFQNCGIVVHFGILGQIADLHIGIAGDAALVCIDCTGQYFQKSGFSGAVDTDNAHFVALVQIEIHIRQQLLHAEIDGKMLC